MKQLGDLLGEYDGLLEERDKYVTKKKSFFLRSIDNNPAFFLWSMFILGSSALLSFYFKVGDLPSSIYVLVLVFTTFLIRNKKNSLVDKYRRDWYLEWRENDENKEKANKIEKKLGGEIIDYVSGN